MKMLALETSSEIGSVALLSAGYLGEREVSEPREQGSRLLPLVDELLAERRMTLGDLDAVVFGRGPGSFTGLRLAAATAQGLAMARGLPLIPVSSLAALAQQAIDRLGAATVLVCVDAHMDEVYWAHYEADDGRPVLVGDEHLTPPSEVPQLAAIGVGSGFSRYPALRVRLGDGTAAHPDYVPRARDLLPLAQRFFAAGEYADPRSLTPVYLRGESAWRKRELPQE